MQSCDKHKEYRFGRYRIQTGSHLKLASLDDEQLSRSEAGVPLFD